jgi:chromosomal replication initiation ATPase DnaA
MAVKQIPLSFPVYDSYDVNDFLPLACNQEALSWVQRFPQWPYPALIIYGEKGCGKTHILHILKTITGNNCMIIDDAQNIFGNTEAEENVFHQFNIAKENGTFLCLAMEKSAIQQNIKLPDLASRLRAAPHVQIQSPDEIALQAVLVKLFHDRQLNIEPDVISYILPRIERTFAAVRDLVKKIDENAMAEKRSVTVPLVREILTEPVLI